MMRLRTTLFLGLGFILVHVRGQGDFDLADALDHPEETITKKPPLTPKRPVFDDHPKPHPRPPHKPQPGSYDNNGDDHPKPQPYPPPHPQPGRHSNTDSFNDLDLNDGKPLPPRPAGEKESNLNHGGNTDSGVVAGVTSPVISVLVLLVVGTVAGYTAYKKKTLCFKANVAQPICYVLPGLEDNVSALKSMGQLCKLAREELPSHNDMINQRYVSYLLVF